MLVRVALDESLINPKPKAPVKPVAPVAPKGYQPVPDEPEKKEPAEGEAPKYIKAPEDVEAPEAEEAAQEDGADDKGEPPESIARTDRNPEFVKHDEALKTYEESKVQYELDLTRFEDDTKAFAEKVAEAQKLVDELNERFGEWFYVMSAENLNTLRTERTDLVAEKKPEPGSEPKTPAAPNISFPDLPIGTAAPEEKKTPMKPTGETVEPAVEGAADTEATKGTEVEVKESEEPSAAETENAAEPETGKPVESVPEVSGELKVETTEVVPPQGETKPIVGENETGTPVESGEKKE